jgi:hypothetical protein
MRFGDNVFSVDWDPVEGRVSAAGDCSSARRSRDCGRRCGSSIPVRRPGRTTFITARRSS